MGIRSFEKWATSRTQTSPLSTLKDAVVGIEAAYYIDRFLKSGIDPLLVATGGFPLATKKAIEDDLDGLLASGITPLFVFSGMDTVKKPGVNEDLRETSRFETQKQAWELCRRYEDCTSPEEESDAKEGLREKLSRDVAQTFRSSGSLRAENLFRFFQKVLREKNVDFFVAPYSAWAQLAYLANSPRQYVDAIMGSFDTLLFEVDRVIVNIDVQQAQFSWISKLQCQDDLGKVSSDMFVDACMLSGSTFLPTFPPLENPSVYQKPFNIRDVVSMMFTMGKTATAVCTHYQDEAQVQRLDYLDRYQRGRLAVKHHVILTDDGKVEPLDVDHAPWDVHEFIGQRLPEELYFYMSKGIIGPRVLNWLTSGQLLERPPLDNGESPQYRRLVRDQLSPLRTQTLALLSQPLSRFYHRKDVTVRFWFDDDLQRTLSHKDIVPAPRDLVSNWNVTQSALDKRVQEIGLPPNTLLFAVRSLADKEFASSTLTAKTTSKLLSSKDEIITNVIWRFLLLRGYIDDRHNLTAWGSALQAAMSTLTPADGLDEAVLIAVELLRLDLLSPENIFSSYVGAPANGSEKDKQTCALISRVACLGTLHAKPIGFTGPLSHSLLAFHSIFSALRDALRDLIEVVAANMLLNADADRDRDDWVDIGLGLPFINDPGCGLGIAVNLYLEEINREPADPSAKRKKTIKEQDVVKLLPNSVDLPADLDTAFRLWDAVVRGVQAAGELVEDSSAWPEADSWLKSRR
ncbi:MAG: hypothetical protein M1825_005390 [Sarcosagium campestre]|nr:MAG: hypothetical protein M1825_005390 [Sarcosagium campestre]